MPNGFLAALGITSLAGLSTGLGALFCLFPRRPGRRALAFSMGFSAGVMVMIAFGCMLAESAEVIGRPWSLILLVTGMLAMWLLDLAVPHGAAEASLQDPDATRLLRAGRLVATGIAIHNIPEGIAVFFGGLHDVHLGWALAVAVALHNIPEGMAIAIPVYGATGNRGKAVVLSVGAGVVEPAAALVTGLALYRFISPAVIAGTMAAAAGFMLYVALDELLPAAHTDQQGHVAIAGVTAGVALMALGIILLEAACR